MLTRRPVEETELETQDRLLAWKDRYPVWNINEYLYQALASTGNEMKAPQKALRVVKSLQISHKLPTSISHSTRKYLKGQRFPHRFTNICVASVLRYFYRPSTCFRFCLRLSSLSFSYLFPPLRHYLWTLSKSSRKSRIHQSPI